MAGIRLRFLTLDLVSTVVLRSCHHDFNPTLDQHRQTYVSSRYGLFSIFLTSVPDSLAIEVFVQNAGPFVRNTGIYVGGDGQAFSNQYPGAPVDLVVSLIIAISPGV